MYVKNQIIDLTITALTNEGDGVGRAGEMVFFVPNTAVGDMIKARVLKVKKTYGFAKLESVVTPSPDRIESDCSVSKSCGGCVFRHVSYDAELTAKRQNVIDVVTRIAKLDPSLVKDIIPSEKIDGYRNKASIPVGLDKNGAVIMGYYARHSHNIMPCLSCRLSPPIFNEIAADFHAFLSQRPELVRTAKNRSVIRHLFLRYAETSGEVMVCIVAGAKRFKDDLLFDYLSNKYAAIRSIVVNINREDTNVILGDRTVCMRGDNVITDTLCGRRFDISAPSFYQVNRAQAERLYAKAREYASLSGCEVLLDLYCGAGTIGLSMADGCRELIGVEIVPEAIENAKHNAAQNGVTNARFICADATQAAAQLRQEGIRPDVIVVDPPRKGLTPDLIATIAGMSPKRVVYVSCDPATMARDLSLFAQQDYSAEEITPVDLFPRTAHCESVCQLIRSSSRS